MYHIPSISADTLTAVIKDTLTRLNVPISKLHGQCYDGASNMRGARSGVATQIQDVEPRAVYTHCYGHSINLAVSDAVRETKTMRDALDVTHEITKLIKFSPRREALLRQIKQAQDVTSTPGIRVLCPTRWTVRADSLSSIVANYAVLQSTWDEAVEVTRDTEMKARLYGVSAQMRKFEFLFGVIVGEMLLRHTDNLSQALQKKTLSAAEGQQIARMVITTLQSLRTEDSYSLFWEKVTTTAESADVADPQLPQQRKTPKRYDDSTSQAYFHHTPKVYYRQIYYKAIDNIINLLQNRFEQPGYQVYCKLEQLLSKACKQENFDAELQFISSFYKDDFNEEVLKCQLLTLGVDFKGTYTQSYGTQQSLSNITIFDIRDYFQSLSPAQRQLLDQVCRVLMIILVMPATNATSERSFSALRRVKNYLRSTMTQQRLNNLMVLHVHKERTSDLSEVDICNDFVADSETRLRIFGKFL